MKKLLLFFVWVCLASLGNSQTALKPYDLDDLKLDVAEYHKVPLSAITFLEVRKYGSESFVYTRLTKDAKPITWVTGLSQNPGGGIPFVGGSITCGGVGCAECDIDGGLKIEDMYCSCKKRVADGGYCNMTKSIGVNP